MTDQTTATTPQVQTNTQQDPTAKKPLFGGNSAVFENLDKFEQISNPVGEATFDFEFEDASPQVQNNEKPDFSVEEISDIKDETISEDGGEVEQKVPEASSIFAQAMQNIAYPEGNTNYTDQDLISQDLPDLQGSKDTISSHSEADSNENIDGLEDSARSESIQGEEIQGEALSESLGELPQSSTSSEPVEKSSYLDQLYQNTTDPEETSPEQSPEEVGVDEEPLEESTPKEDREDTQEVVSHSIVQRIEESPREDHLEENKQKSEDNDSVEESLPEPSAEQIASQAMESESTSSQTVLFSKYLGLLDAFSQIKAYQNKLELEEQFVFSGGMTSQGWVSYAVFSDSEEGKPVLMIRKKEVSTQGEESEHELALTSESGERNVIVKIDGEILYQEEQDLSDATRMTFVKDKLNKFEFFFLDKLKELKSQRDKKEQEREKKAGLMMIFRNF